MVSFEEFTSFFLDADEDVRASVVEILLLGQQNPSGFEEDSDIDDKTQ